MINLQDESKLLREKENILCKKHKIFAKSICIEKDCKNVINCIDCIFIDNHTHVKNINISNILNKKIDNQLFNEEFYDQKKIEDLVNEEIEDFRQNINEEIDLFKNNIFDKIQNDSKEIIILEAKKNFQKSRENFLKKNDSLELLKKLGINFFNFSQVRNSTDYLYSENILQKLKSGLIIFKKNIKKLFTNFKIQIKENFFFENSQILKEEDQDFIQKLFENKLTNAKLLYRGSEHGFRANKFRELCSKKGPTLTIIKSGNNEVFGGYIKESWNNNNYQSCKEDFIYSLKKKEKYLQKVNNTQIFYNSSPNTNMLVFGSNQFGNDICIRNECDINRNYYSFGNSFHVPKIYNNQNNSMFGNKSKNRSEFLVKELEIYSVEFD